MSNNYNSKQLSDFEQEIEEEIEQARIELTTLVLEKQKNIILRMGHVLEKIHKDDRQSGICEELKLRLREEIARNYGLEEPSHIIVEETSAGILIRKLEI